ncbi:MAG: aminotransferase class V-fold PLP-dependent enzyme [Salinirussus sp.]
MDPETLRAEIPALEDCVYLNTGASSPSPRQVVEAVTDCHKRQQYDAPAGAGIYETWMEARADARSTIADHVGADPAELALTDSTVDGINHVATSIDWEPGDVVVRTDLEHPAGELPWARMRDRHGIEIREVSTDRGHLAVEDLKPVLGDARLVCLSSIAWNYGTRLPVGEAVDVAHDAGARVLVDAVQSPGQMPVDVSEWGADFVAASGHKWLLGPWGAGLLYVDESALESLRPGRIGYFSVERETDDWTSSYRFRPDASRFEIGTSDVAPHAGLAAAVETIEAVGLGTIQSRIERLTDRLKAGLGDRLLSPRRYESGLVTFAAEDPDATVERLREAGVRIRSLPEPRACRASVHVFNTAGDVDALLDAL